MTHAFNDVILNINELPALKEFNLNKPNKVSIWPEIPEDALLTRQQVVAILHIGMSTLDSLIPDSELPRVRLSKRVFVLKKDLEAYILAHRSTGGAPIPVGGAA